MYTPKTKNPTKIRRAILQTWKKNHDLPPLFQRMRDHLRRLHDGSLWKYEFYEDQDIDMFFHKEMPELESFYRKLSRRIQQIDFFRYCVIYRFGGVYCDMDILLHESLDSLLSEHEPGKMVFPAEYVMTLEDFHSLYPQWDRIVVPPFPKTKTMTCLGNYMFACPPRHPGLYRFLSFLMKDYDRRSFLIQQWNHLSDTDRKSREIMYTTGPYILTEFYVREPQWFQPVFHDENFRFGRWATHTMSGTWR